MQNDKGKNSKWKNGITIWAAAITVLILWGFHDLRSQTNRIQRSRVESCERTYDGIREVFKPFFPDPKHATPDQIANEQKFNTTIDKLKAKCAVQVGVITTTTNPSAHKRSN